METNNRSDTFYKVHSRIIWCNHISGIVVPAFPYKGRLYRVVLEVYVLIMNALSIVSTVAFVGGVLFVPDLEFITVSSTGTCTSTLVYVTVVGLLTLGKRKDFSDLTERTGEILDICSTDPLDTNRIFTKKYYRNVKFLITYFTYLLGITTMVATLYVLPGYIQNFKSLGFSGDSDLEFPLWLPFEYKESPYLDIAFLIEVFAILIAGWRKICTECLLLSYLNCQIQYLRHIKYTLKTVFVGEPPENKSNEVKLQLSDSTKNVPKTEEKLAVCELPSQQEKLKHWITMHQEILKLGTIIMETYNSIIAGYMVSIIVIVTFGIFTAVQKEPGPEERILIAGTLFYSVTTMCSYYMLCHFGSLVKFESQEVAQLGYFSKWYNTDRKIKSSMKIIFERTKSPLLITAYGSPMFDVSKETYLAFMKSIVSFYLTLSHFNDEFKK